MVMKNTYKYSIIRSVMGLNEKTKLSFNNFKVLNKHLAAGLQVF